MSHPATNSSHDHLYPFPYLLLLLLFACVLAGCTTLATLAWRLVTWGSVDPSMPTCSDVVVQSGLRFSVTALISASLLPLLAQAQHQLPPPPLGHALPPPELTGGVDLTLAMPSASQATAAAQMDGAATALITATMMCVLEAPPVVLAALALLPPGQTGHAAPAMGVLSASLATAAASGDGVATLRTTAEPTTYVPEWCMACCLRT